MYEIFTFRICPFPQVAIFQSSKISIAEKTDNEWLTTLCWASAVYKWVKTSVAVYQFNKLNYNATDQFIKIYDISPFF